MDVETFTNQIATAHSKCGTEIKEIFSSAFEKEEENIRAKIDEIIKEQFLDFKIEEIEIILADGFSSINRAQERTSVILTNKVESSTKAAVGLSSWMPMERVSSSLSVLTHELVNDNCLDIVNDPASVLLKNIVSYLKNYVSKLDYLNEKEKDERLFHARLSIDNYITRKVEEVKNNVKIQLTGTLRGYVSDAISIIKEYVNANALSMNNLNSKKREFALAGYTVQKDETGLYLINNNNNRRTDLLEYQDDLYVSKDGNVRIIVNDSLQVIDHSSSIIISNSHVAIGYETSPYDIEVNFINDDYVFYYNSQKIDDPIRIKIIIDNIRTRYPALYEKFCQSENFNKISEMAKKSDEQQDKLRVDESGIVRVVDENREDLNKRAGVLGYKIVEQEDGVYFSKDDNLYKAKYDNNIIELEGNNISIVPDFYIVGKNNITGPLIKYSNMESKITFFSSVDNSHMILFVEDEVYSLEHNNGVVSYSVKINGNKLDDNAETRKKAEESFKTYFPNALAIFNEKYNKEAAQTPTALELLDELESEKIEEQVNEVQEQINMDDRLFELEQDPKVKEYIELMKKQQELSSTSNGLNI